MNIYISNLKTKTKHKGFVLIIALIFLLALSFLAMVSMEMSSTQNRLATNTSSSQISLQTAEGGLVIAQDGLLSNQYTSFAESVAGSGTYLFNSNIVPIWQNNNLSTSNSLSANFLGNSISSAQFIIEQMPSVAVPGQSVSSPQYGGGTPQSRVYRITSQGYGPDGAISSKVQTVFHE